MLAQDLGQVGRYHSKCQYADTYSNFHFQAIIEESSCPLYIYYDPTKENQVQVKMKEEMKEDSHQENNQK
ncbi:hypothetical protein [Caviibacterium pharyngocola]|uniref:Uncharacterized protein n=1 Tax=Caviibacterium pharyngocola TaxID=28159 RepID=A0A2M8RVE4_9PAST|nr:hypothetical protein [Caviibacterium pharyngocola]PJG82845.1 hypothetical protein CVP04_05615 [Caviibacterium pharyngocola]